MKNAPIIVILWLIGVFVLSLRLLGGWIFTRRMTHTGSHVISGSWELRLQHLCQRVHCKIAVRLRESIHVNIPLTLGHFKPIIFFPVGLLIGLPPEEAEALLVHELAHILRRDYLCNLLQCMIDILYFYHPAVYWISTRIRQEREHCCDDLAASLTGNPEKMALALVRIHAWKGKEPVLAQCASGKRHLLLHRIRRLLKMNTKEPSILRTSFWTSLFVLFLGVAFFGLQAAGKNKVSREPIAEPTPILAPAEVGNASQEKEIEKQRALVAAIRKEVEQMQAKEARLNQAQKQDLQSLRLKLLREAKILQLLEGNEGASGPKRMPPVPPVPQEPVAPLVTALPQPVPVPEPVEIEEMRVIAEQEIEAHAHELEVAKEEARQHQDEAERARVIAEEHAQQFNDQLKQEEFERQRVMQDRTKSEEKSRLNEEQKRMMKERSKMEVEERRMKQIELELRAKEFARQKLETLNLQRESERMKALDDRLKRLEERLSALAATLESIKNQPVPPSEKK